MLEKTLEDHALWFKTKGKEGKLASLKEVDLSHSVLKGAVLVEANLAGASFEKADLSHADLRGSNLCDANLSEANLTGANLEEADLRFSDLTDTNLKDAQLGGAYLQGVDLSKTIGLTRDQLCEAFTDEATRFPKDVGPF